MCKVTVKEITDVLHEAGLHANVYKSGSDVMLDVEDMMTADITIYYLRSERFLVIGTHRLTPHLYKIERDTL
jgi:glycine cleavage system aminomethyltransferase T